MTIILDMQSVLKVNLDMKVVLTQVNYYKLKSTIDKVIQYLVCLGANYFPGSYFCMVWINLVPMPTMKIDIGNDLIRVLQKI